ncbi:hypothetical protein CGQ24_08255 [Arthrobacter sp. 7749]|nr:hypothetical protein CGQ24_08255 [Arthrobacter sp. 7749]
MPECTGTIECGCWGHVQLAQSGDKYLGEYEYVLDDLPGRWPYSLAKKLVKLPEYCVVHQMVDPEMTDPDSDGYPRAIRGTNLCTECAERMIADARTIASRWDDAMDALHRGSGGGSEERVGTKVDAPLPINPAPSDAMREARAAVWSIVGQLVQDRPTVQLPADQSTPVLAEWLSRWHMGVLSTHPSPRHTRSCYWSLAHAADQMVAATLGVPVEVAVQAQCTTRLPKPKLGKAALGPQCGGELVAIERADGKRQIKCSKDPEHMIAYESWALMQAARKPRSSRAKNTVIKRLNRQLDLA